METQYVFIDESGTLPDFNDKYIVVAAVLTENRDNIDLIFKKSATLFRNKRAPEMKFYHASDKAKINILGEISQSDIKLFLLAINKNERKIDDSPENYAAICSLLLRNVFSNKNTSKFLLTFDRHFYTQQDIDKFNAHILPTTIKKCVSIEHVDSKKYNRVNIADIVAGATLAKFSGKDSRYYEIIKKRVVSGGVYFEVQQLTFKTSAIFS